MPDSNPYESPSLAADESATSWTKKLFAFCGMLLAVPTGLGVFLFAFLVQLALLKRFANDPGEAAFFCLSLAAIIGVVATVYMWRQTMGWLRQA